LRLLLDSHYILWIVSDSQRLSLAEKTILRGDVTPIIPSVGLWELNLKWQKLGKSGERRLDIVPANLLATIRDLGWEIVVLDPDSAVATLDVPIPHKDPFDVLLLVQAQQLGIQLFSRDDKLIGHPLVFTPDAP
jgi:PIN domain nuclease of toxin-antitoxin system